MERILLELSNRSLELALSLDWGSNQWSERGRRELFFLGFAREEEESRGGSVSFLWNVAERESSREGALPYLVGHQPPPHSTWVGPQPTVGRARVPVPVHPNRQAEPRLTAAASSASGGNVQKKPE